MMKFQPAIVRLARRCPRLWQATRHRSSCQQVAVDSTQLYTITQHTTALLSRVYTINSFTTAISNSLTGNLL